MLSQEDRIKLFKAEMEAVEKKYQFEIVGVLQVTPQGIIPGLTLLDRKPAFVAPPGMNAANPPQNQASSTPSNANGIAKN